MDLYTTGALTVRLTDPERYFAFSELPPAEMRAVFREEEAKFRAAATVLPDTPDEAAAEAFVQKVRRRFLD